MTMKRLLLLLLCMGWHCSVQAAGQPNIVLVFIDDMGAHPLGGGEPSVITVGAMIANAVYNACGANILDNPVTPEKIWMALRGH